MLNAPLRTVSVSLLQEMHKTKVYSLQVCSRRRVHALKTGDCCSVICDSPEKLWVREARGESGHPAHSAHRAVFRAGEF